MANLIQTWDDALMGYIIFPVIMLCVIAWVTQFGWGF